ncbi:hypothetical protein B0I32_117194 [Nonomuraea fuscirosea]|uniref:Uncharacterized protein n=1 Tax=Nonomuraea fuscirosea TaxID=1291556 RepID=A0A2T0MQQ4_9ACTN|nr:hypothetical protein B0I32_117194 [Nonomuraea fuscirosea]
MIDVETGRIAGTPHRHDVLRVFTRPAAEAAVRHRRARSTSLVSGLSAMGSSSVTITVPPTWAR